MFILKKRMFNHQVNKQYGLAVIEMLISVPLLVMLLFATVEFGRLFNSYNELTKSVGNAARYLSENAITGNSAVPNIDPVRTNAKNIIIYGNIGGGSTGEELLPGLTVNETTDFILSTSGGLSYVTVQVDWVYQTLLKSSIPTFSYANNNIDISNLTLNASAKFRVLN